MKSASLSSFSVDTRMLSAWHRLRLMTINDSYASTMKFAAASALPWASQLPRLVDTLSLKSPVWQRKNGYCGIVVWACGHLSVRGVTMVDGISWLLVRLGYGFCFAFTLLCCAAGQVTNVALHSAIPFHCLLVSLCGLKIARGPGGVVLWLALNSS